MFSNKGLLPALGLPDNCILHEIPDFPVLGEIAWQRFILPRRLKSLNVDILFSADSASFAQYPKQVVLNQDLLPYHRSANQKSHLRLKFRNFAIRLVQKRVFHRAAGVIFLSGFCRETIKSRTGQIGKSVIIPHGFDEVFLDAHDAISAFDRRRERAPVRLLYISNYLPYKAHEILLRAFLILVKEFNLDVYLTIIGGGGGRGYRDLKGFIQSNFEIRERVKLLPFLSKVETINYLRKSDLFVFPSQVEAFGITFLEALSTGIPCVVSNSTGLIEIHQGLVDEFSPFAESDVAVSLRQSIDRLPRLLESRNERVDQARAFSWDKTAEQTFSFLEEIYRGNVL